jgi:hypothetical protein
MLNQASSIDGWHFSAIGVGFLRAGQGRAHGAREAWVAELNSEPGCRRPTDGAALAERRVLRH